MAIKVDCHVVYGVQIERLPDDLYWQICDDQKEKVTEQVRLASLGEYDNEDHFLVTSWEEKTPGQPFVVAPYSATDPQIATYDADLVEAAELIGAKLTGQIGWIFIPNEY